MFTSKYPYTDTEQLNLDWILGQMVQLRTDMRDFVKLNTIKYADPIRWNIINQYEANTVVVDQDGNAYLSTQPVPAGVNINNTDYWTEIGNFSELFSSVKESIAAADEGSSTYASVNREVGDLVWLSDILYRVTVNMVTGESYIEGTNCEKITIEDLLDNVNDEIGDINERIDILKADFRYVNVKDHGAKGDGVTDDTEAIRAAIAAAKTEGNEKPVYFPAGSYLISETLNFYRVSLFGEGIKNTKLLFSAGHLYIGHQGIYCCDLYVELLAGNNDAMAIECYYMTQAARLENVYCRNGGISMTRSWYFTVSNIYVSYSSHKSYGLKLFGTAGEGGVNAGNFNGIFLYGGTVGVLIDGANYVCETNIFNACTIEGFSQEAIKLINGASTHHFNGVYCENSAASTTPIVATVDDQSGYLICNDVMVRGTQTADTLFSGDVISFNIICTTTAKKICTDGKTIYYGIRNTSAAQGTILTTTVLTKETITNTSTGYCNFGIKNGYQLIKAYTEDGHTCSEFFINSYKQHYGIARYQGVIDTTPTEREYTCIWIKRS